MAIYHFSAKVISRANGSSAVASAAYRSASELHDGRLRRSHDFSNKAGVIHSEVMLPKGAPERLLDRATLWNEVEAGEKRKDAQLAREVEFAIPREMNEEQGVALARDFVDEQFVKRGMVADLNVHWDKAEDGSPKPHAHVMLSMREVGPDGFGKKVRDWNGTELLKGWREAWADHVNERLSQLDLDARIDHRTLEAQGIDLEPQHKIGPAGMRRLDRGEDAERADDHRRIARENGAKIVADPGIALDAITRSQATFTTRDLARFVHRHSDGKEQFDQTMGAVRGSAGLVALGRDGRGEERFTSRDMIAVEARLDRAADGLAGSRSHGVGDRQRDRALRSAEDRGLVLSGEQRDALAHVTGDADLASVVGYAGTGKSAMLGVAREAWEGAGYRVRGAALSGIAAENLEGGSGIASRTIASLEHQWGQGRELLEQGDVLVIDEAGLIGSRQMERVLSQAEERGAKVVLVGDPEQLQAIEAGAAFRSVAERHGAAEMTEVRRQREGWQRDATRRLATGRTGEALDAYAAHGMVQGAETREAARGALMAGWDAARRADRDGTQIILTHTNAEVRDLNLLARDAMRKDGQLGDDVGVTVERGQREFATGDRIMFLRNDRGMGVKNGTLGTVERVGEAGMGVRLDDGREVGFDLKDYTHVDHGYAATFHKSQGVTVDRAHVLATPGMDRHAAYVGLSRHRDDVQLHYGRDDFADGASLARTLSRERTKDMAADHAPDRAFADRRKIRLPDAPVRQATPPAPAKARGMFDGFRPKVRTPDQARSGPGRDASVATPDAARQSHAIQGYARAWADAERMREQGMPVLAHQQQALARAGDALDATRPDGARDLSAALERNPALARDAAQGRTGSAQRGMILETAVRTDPARRADRFVEQWREHGRERDERVRVGDRDGAAGMTKRMGTMTDTLRRDPELAKALEKRAPELAIRLEPGRSIDRALGQSIGMGQDRDRDRGISR